MANVMGLEQRLLTIKGTIKESEKQVSESEGALKLLFSQLKDSFGCKDLDSARELLQKKRDELDQLDVQIEEGTAELEQKLNL
jgi:hypothetical protein